MSRWHEEVSRRVVVTDWKIWFDPRAFDVEFARSRINARYEPWDDIPLAFDEAVQKYAKRGAFGAVPRKRVKRKRTSSKGRHGRVVKSTSGLQRG